MDLLVRYLRMILTAIGFGVGDGRRRTMKVRIGLSESERTCGCHDDPVCLHFLVILTGQGHISKLLVLTGVHMCACFVRLLKEKVIYHQNLLERVEMCL